MMHAKQRSLNLRKVYPQPPSYEGPIVQQEGHAPYAIYYISKNLAPAELNYTVTEK